MQLVHFVHVPPLEVDVNVLFLT